MKAIIGLGNPGPDYDKTRHNAGFLTVDGLAERFGATYWKLEAGCEVAHIKAEKISEDFQEEVVLAKPQSFMNLSGGPVKSLCEKYKLSLDDIIVVHDDLDLEPSTIRVKRGGGSGGHNGLKSIDEKLCSKDYTRVRVAIGRPPGRMPVVDYVLSRPKGSNLEYFETSINAAQDAAEFLLTHTLEQAQQEFN